MLDHLVARPTAKTIPIKPVSKKQLGRWLPKQSARLRNWVKANGYKGAKGTHLVVPTEDGLLDCVLLGVGDGPWSWAGLPKSLPDGRYLVDADLKAPEADAAALGWALGCYQFTKYKAGKPRAKLVWPKNADKGRVSRLVTGIGLARDLINTPAGDLGPTEMAAAARSLARKHKAKCTVIKGDALLQKNYPTVHAVGRAAENPPHLIDITWGSAKKPKLTLVGKGVCFDTGGLDLKSAAGMKLMKKDMGGAATVFGLAHAIMDAKLPVRLRVLVPTVENSVSGNAYRPLDVIKTRSGKTVEVGNTDAEGRLILCDALHEAASEKPDLIIDMATLTGAARVALGTELPALFSTDDRAASTLLAAGIDAGDPLWRMPLHDAYRKGLDTPVADLNNISNSGFGGAITAALFLREFVGRSQAWMHIDTMAFNNDNKPGRPKGGEAFGLRALYTMLERRYRK